MDVRGEIIVELQAEIKKLKKEIWLHILWKKDACAREEKLQSEINRLRDKLGLVPAIFDIRK